MGYGKRTGRFLWGTHSRTHDTGTILRDLQKQIFQFSFFNQRQDVGIHDQRTPISSTGAATIDLFFQLNAGQYLGQS